jgi:LysM repeat protein
MKKITESQLKDRVNSLREYLKVYEDDIPFDPTWGGTKAPADTRNFWQRNAPNFLGGQDAPQAANKNATWNNAQQAAVSNQPKAPQDLANMDIGFGPGKFAPDDANQSAKVTPAVPAAPTGTQVQTDDNGNHTITTPDGKTMVVGPDGKPLENGGKEAPAPGPTAVKIARFKELLAKAAAPAAAAPAAAAAQSPYSLAGQGAKLKANESTTYFLNKLRLIESRQLNEALTPEEQKEMDSLYAELGNTEVPEPGVAELINQYNTLKKPAPWSAAPAAPERGSYLPPAAVTASGPVTWKQIYDANKDVIGANPNLIKPGQQLKMPDGSTYTVKAGDNLSKIAKNAGGGQGASVTPTAPKPPKAPELTQTQQNLKNAGYPSGTEMRTPAEIAASAGLADATPNPDAGLEPSDPRHSGHAAWKAQQAPQAASVTPKKTFKPYPKDSRYDKEDKAKLAAAQPKVTAESVGYNELQRIVSLVNHR